MILRRFRIFLALVVASLFVMTIQGQDVIFAELLALINNERANAEVGGGLTINQGLVQAAQIHSEDMARTENLTHVGSDGSQFWERMQMAGYNLANGSELVLSANALNAQTIFDQWWSSPEHRAGLLNPEFQDIGFAYAQSPLGVYYFTLLVGVQSGVAVAEEPSTAIVPPTQIPTEIQVTPTLTFTPSITPILPTSTPFPTLLAAPTATPIIFATPTRLPTETLLPPTPTPFVPQSQDSNSIEQDQVEQPSVSGPPTLSPLQLEATRIAPTPTLTLTPAPPDIRLVFDENSFAIINISGRELNLRTLSFVSEVGQLLASEWDNGFLAQPLERFPQNGCLQAWAGGTATEPPNPEGCNARQSWINVTNRARFWLNTDTFLVRNDGQSVGFCNTFNSGCELSTVPQPNLLLPDALLNVNPRPIDLLLVYDFDSFTLINISGAAADLSGLEFDSANGYAEIGYWDTQFLAQPLSRMPDGNCIQTWEAGREDVLARPSECRSRAGWVPVLDGSWFWRDADEFNVIRDGTTLGVCSISQGSCEISLSLGIGSTPIPPGTDNQSEGVDEDFGVDIRLIYSDISVTLVNISGGNLDLSGITLESDNGVYAASAWDNGFLGRPLDDFPTGSCLQIWSVGSEIQSIPPDCQSRQSWNAVGFDAEFWLNVDNFRVRNNGSEVGTCEASAGVCDIDF